MKLNRLAFLGMTSAVLAIAPISHAIADQSPAAIVTQNQVTQNQVAQSQSAAVASGTFVAGEAPTTGTARIVTEGGHRYLELDTAFSTSSMGPDLHVLLDSTARPPKAYDNLGGVVNLGRLHDFTGAQRYPIPDAINLANFDSVVIWCRMANATFGYAPLNPVKNAGL